MGQENGVKALVEFESEESLTNIAPVLPKYFSSVGHPNIMWRVDRAYKVASTPKKSPVQAEPLDLSDSSYVDSKQDSDDSGTPLIRKPPIHYKKPSMLCPQSPLNAESG